MAPAREPAAGGGDGGRPIAFVSMDVDPIDTHLAGYGIAAPPCELVYRTAVPRFLDLLERLGLRATLFVVARDAERHAALWRQVRARGHEIASHSVTHPVPFASLPPAALAEELAASRRRLEASSEGPVVGFRAPGWDVDRATLRAVAAAGYRYDASLLPTPALLGGAVLRFVLSAGRMRPQGLRRALWAAFARRAPHRAGTLHEFPVAVSPRLRVPFTHTLWYVAPRAVCARAYRALRQAGTPLSYMLHAADLLALADGVDPRLARHPGMRLPLERKLALLEERLGAIATDYHVRRYADVIGVASGDEPLVRSPA